MSEVQAPLRPDSFGSLLKSWRATRKVSQLDLALDSNVSQRHLSFLKPGRANPSQQMVLQLAEALEVPLRERNTLLQAAGFACSYHQRGLDDETMAPIRGAFSSMLDHHDPFPAIVVDREFNLMMENRAFTTLMSLFGDPAALWRACCPAGSPNFLRLIFHPQGAHALIRNFDEIAPLLLHRAWRDTSINGGEIHAFISELRNDPSLPKHWHNPDSALTPLPVLPLVLGQDDLEFRLFTMISTFGTPHDETTDEIWIETFSPADVATENLLRKLSDTETN